MTLVLQNTSAEGLESLKTYLVYWPKNVVTGLDQSALIFPFSAQVHNNLADTVNM